MRSVLFLVLDSMRRDHLGVYEDSIECTDHLDRIAAESIVYENVVSQAPWTLPSHASMFTGRYPWEHEATNKHAHLETDVQTLAEKFDERGYETAAITPNIWLTPHKGMTDGFDEVENFLGWGSLTPLQKMYRMGSAYLERSSERVRRSVVEPLNHLFDSMDIDTSCRSAETVDAAIDFLEANGDERFFLFVNLMEPHEPYEPPREYLERHDVKDLDLVPDDNEDFFTGDTDYEELRKAYRASIDYTDDLVGRLDRALAENELDDAVLVIAGDHGQALGEDDVFGHQFTVRDEVVSVPLLVRHPAEPARRNEDLVELRELYRLLPTFAGFERYDDLGTEAVLGGYEFPRVFRRYIDDDLMDQYFRKYRFYRTKNEKLVKTEWSDGTVSYTRFDLDTGEELPTDAGDEWKLDRLGEVESEDPLDATTEPSAVESRLEELGYL